MAQRVSSSRFVGRRQQLAELESALSSEGSDLPALFLLAGESGVGKTRLLGELIAVAEAQGAHPIGGACVGLGDDEFPYAPLVAALRPLQRSGSSTLERLPASTRAQLARLNPEIGIPSTDFETERGEAQRRLFDAILELISALGEERPALLWIEDIHWADRSTRSFLRFLAANLDREQVQVVATYRTDELHRRHPLWPLLADLERAPHVRRIALTRFDRDELADQLADILGEDPDATVVDRLYGRSDGNPLFTEELLAAGTDGRGSLPPSMREALLLRAERLSDPCQRLLRHLSVAGRADEKVLGAAMEVDPAELSASLREGIDAQIVVTLDDGRFGFRHALLQEVLYDDLLPGERSRLHLALAAALERVVAADDSIGAAMVVAHHYYSAGDQPQALRTALIAAEAANRLHAYGEAAAMLGRALELWPRVDEPERVSGVDESEVLTRAARAHYLAGDDAVGADLYERAIEGFGERADPERLADTLTALAACQWSLGRAERSRETQRRGLALLSGHDDSPARARLLAQQVRFLLLQGRYGEVCEAAPDAVEAAERLGLDSELSGVLNRLGCALLALGREQEGRERMDEAIEIAERSGSPGDLATVYLNYADALHVAGLGLEARDVAERGLRRAQERMAASSGATTRSMRFIHVNLSEIDFDHGNWERSEEELRAGAHRNQGVGQANVLLRGAALALARARDEEARVALAEAEDLLRDALEPQYIALLATLQAELAQRAGEIEQARRAIDDGIDRIQFCSEDGTRIALIAVAGLNVEAESAERARDLDDGEAERVALARADRFRDLVRAVAEDGERPVESAMLAVGEAEHARAAGDDDPALWDRAAESWERLKRPYPLAIARWRQAQASLGRADRVAAQAALAEAREIAARLGAAWLQAEIAGLAARARLSTRKPRDPAAEDPPGEEAPFGLTPRELQVLGLVSSGATNREIGERLYMAEKTASVHVSRILAKLDVRGRTEAAAIAHRHGIGSDPPD